MDATVPMVQGLGSNPGFPSTCLASTVPGKFQRWGPAGWFTTVVDIWGKRLTIH
jgi:hypothetical protein